MSTNYSESETIIRHFDADLVRAQYSLAIHKTTRAKSNLIRADIAAKLKSDKKIFGNAYITFNHIDLVHQQDAVMAICRMMDATRSTSSVPALIKKLNKTDWLHERCRDIYSQSDSCPVQRQLLNDLVKEKSLSIDIFIRLYKSLEKSSSYQELKKLRDSGLAHRGTQNLPSIATIKMAETCLCHLEKLLKLAYLIFLNTDYDPKLGREHALNDARIFWSLFVLPN